MFKTLFKTLRTIFILTILTLSLLGLFSIIYIKENPISSLERIFQKSQVISKPIKNTLKVLVENDKNVQEKPDQAGSEHSAQVDELEKPFILENKKIKLCQSIFSKINSINRNFFQNQSCDAEIIYLKSFNLPTDIVNILDEVASLCETHCVDLIKNKALYKILRIQKLSNMTPSTKLKKEKFSANMERLQQYFYSKNFINLCE